MKDGIEVLFEFFLITLILTAGATGVALLGAYGAQVDTPVVAAQQEDPHEWQPEHCSNAKTAPKAHKCECKKSAESCDVEDKACKVYCRKNKCYCFHPACDS